MGERSTQPDDRVIGPLVELFVDCGLDDDQAADAAAAAYVRLACRVGASNPSTRRGGSLRAALVHDPMVSFNRLVGTGDAGLPFYDDEDGRLSAVAFTTVLGEIGLDPDVAFGFAKVIVEIAEASTFFTGVWTALGREGPVDLDELRTLDWSPLRAGLDLPAHQGGTPPPAEPGARSPRRAPLANDTVTLPAAPRRRKSTVAGGGAPRRRKSTVRKGPPRPKSRKP